MLQVSFSARGSIPLRTGGRLDDIKLGVTAGDPESDAHLRAFRLSERLSGTSTRSWISCGILLGMRNIPGPFNGFFCRTNLS